MVTKIQVVVLGVMKPLSTSWKLWHAWWPYL